MLRYLAAAAMLITSALPATAQDGAPTITAEQALANAAARYTIRPPRPQPCPQASGDEIVVCRELLDPGSQGLPSPTEQAIIDGVRPPDPIPQAPDFAGPSQNVVGRFGAPVIPLIIDLEAIPEAPPGSDAARYSGT
jgi:hypothetical protein